MEVETETEMEMEMEMPFSLFFPPQTRKNTLPVQNPQNVNNIQVKISKKMERKRRENRNCVS